MHSFTHGYSNIVCVQADYVDDVTSVFQLLEVRLCSRNHLQTSLRAGSSAYWVPCLGGGNNVHSVFGLNLWIHVLKCSFQLLQLGSLPLAQPRSTKLFHQAFQVGGGYKITV
jgi:hypothetical protein